MISLKYNQQVDSNSSPTNQKLNKFSLIRGRLSVGKSLPPVSREGKKREKQIALQTRNHRPRYDPVTRTRENLADITEP